MRESKIWLKIWRLTVLDEWKEWKYYRAKCLCDCWNISIPHSHSLWIQTSCGCYMRERISEIHSKHKKSSSRIYKIYSSIKQRCSNKNNQAYNNYWWRYIICEWKTFEEFYRDMAEWYIDWNSLELDRIDNNWNYCKENCRWTTHTINNRNKRNNVFYQWKCISEWCEELWLNRSTVFVRIFRWKSIKDALGL